MPDVTPVGLAALPLQNFRITLAASTTFQELVGAANAAEALERVLWWELTGEDLNRAAVRFADQVVSRKTFDSLTTGGGINVVGEFTLPEEYVGDAENTAIMALNKTGQINRELFSLGISDPATYLNITNIEIHDIGYFDRNERNAVWGWGFHLLVEWQGVG